MPAINETVDQVKSVEKYKYGFVTDIDSEFAPKGLSEDIVRFISAKKEEPAWLLEWRIKAYRHWLTMDEPDWAKIGYPPIDYNDAYYYSAPKSGDEGPESLDEVDPELLATYEKLGIPIHEQEVLAGVKNVAVDAVFDSVSVATTFKETLAGTFSGRPAAQESQRSERGRPKQPPPRAMGHANEQSTDRAMMNTHILVCMTCSISYPIHE